MKSLTRKQRRGERKETLEQKAHDGEMGAGMWKLFGHGGRRLKGKKIAVGSG